MKTLFDDAQFFRKVQDVKYCYKWYCVMTSNMLQICEAVCFRYEPGQDIRTHPVVKFMDDKWNAAGRYWFHFVFVDAHKDYDGVKLTDIYAGDICYAANERERLEAAARVQTNLYHIGFLATPFQEIHLGGKKPWPLPWVVLWMGSRGYDAETAMIFGEQMGFRGVLFREYQTQINAGSVGWPPAPPLTNDEEDVLVALIEDL